MRRMFLLALILGSASACSRLPDPPQPQGDLGPPQTEVAVLTIAEDGTRTNVIEPIAIGRIAGEYHTKDLCRDVLNLNTDGTFRYEELGCVGSLGLCTGNWALDHDGVQLRITTTDSWPKARPTVALQVLSLRGHYLLLAENFKDHFNMFGVGIATCLHKWPAEDAIEAVQRRSFREGRK